MISVNFKMQDGKKLYDKNSKYKQPLEAIKKERPCANAPRSFLRSCKFQKVNIRVTEKG